MSLFFVNDLFRSYFSEDTPASFAVFMQSFHNLREPNPSISGLLLPSATDSIFSSPSNRFGLIPPRSRWTMTQLPSM